MDKNFNRLTKYKRESIRMKLINHRFHDDYIKLFDKFGELAVDVYNTHYTAAMRRKMRDLPKGWLIEKEKINFTAGNKYVSLHFNGISSFYSYYSDVKYTSEERAHIKLPFLGRDTENRAITTLVDSHPLVKVYDKLMDEYSKLEENVNIAKRYAENMLSSVTTINKLVTLWPEVEPFIDPVEKKFLPAVKIDDLNNIFKLDQVEK